MREFLDVAETLRDSGETGDKSGHFDLVLKALSALQGVHSKAQLDIGNIESVFAAFENGGTS